MLEARGGDDKSSLPVNNRDEIVHGGEPSSHDINERKLLTTISQIDPKKLESTSHDEYIKSLADILSSSLNQDYSQLLLFTQAIKDCGKPCYKRDVLIETLNQVFVVQDDKILLKLLCDISHQTTTTNKCRSDFVPWKEMANSIVTLPDLIANCGLIKRFSGFLPKCFYKMVLDTICQSLSTLCKQHGCFFDEMREEIAFFYAHLIGRIAIGGYRTLVWERFTSRLSSSEESLRSVGSTILCIPIRSAEFEIFIEPLYGPIFYHMRPNPSNGKLIESIIGTSLLENETLQHIVCKKYILQTNFDQDRHRQNLILYNIFSYLSCLAGSSSSNNKLAAATSRHDTTRHASNNDIDSSGGYEDNSGGKRDTGELQQQQGPDVLIETVLDVARSWSNTTKILLRPYEHNRYIGCALVMALKFTLKSEHKQSLLKIIDEIQSEIIGGLQVYLSRSSSQVRNMAMCAAEISLTSLHDLMDAEFGNKDSGKRVPLELNVEWDESCLAIKRMFHSDDVTFCKELAANTVDSHDDDGPGDHANLGTVNRPLVQNHRYPSAPTTLSADRVEAVSDEVVDKDSDGDTDYEDNSSMNAPIYLNDCMSGLIDNNNSRYVKICLLKVGELICQLSKPEEDSNISQSVGKVKNYSDNRLDVLKKSTTNDAIRDVAMELAQVLLYLEDQYSMDNFDTLQRQALVSLTVAAPDLVAKYLLDELNNQSKNIRQQTLIMQTLIESAQQLGNRFTKYGALYFYGMVHQLKTISTLTTAMLPSSHVGIVSAVKSIKADQEQAKEQQLLEKLKQQRLERDELVASDDSYLLSRVLLSVSLIIKCLNQQLITCKLSNDLLDILAAYRHHPDSGVRKAIVRCLTVVRDCTPAVYFREHLNDKTAQLFGAWLAIIESDSL